MNSIKIPENHPGGEQLKKVAKTLLEFLPLHSMYFSVDNKEFSPKIIITLFLSDECELDSNDVEPFVERVFKSYPTFSLSLFEQRWAADIWEGGSPFLMLHATIDELAYSSDPSNLIFSLGEPGIRKLLRKAQGMYDYFDTSAQTFFRNVTYYERYEDYLQAAFHIHQALQMIYILTSKISKGDYYATGDLKDFQVSFISFTPTLKNLFDIENKEEFIALEQLSKSSYAIKNNKKHEFTKEAIELATSKTQSISREVRVFLKHTLKSVRRKSRLQKRML